MDNASEVVEQLRFSVASILSDNLVGIYLCGSLATGDFDPETSDIDFCVVSEYPADRWSEDLRTMHESLWSSHESAAKLEGAYLDRTQIRSAKQDERNVPCVNEDRFYLAPLGRDWTIQRHIIRERGW